MQKGRDLWRIAAGRRSNNHEVNFSPSGRLYKGIERVVNRIIGRIAAV
jgi:hypothetical protein